MIDDRLYLGCYRNMRREIVTPETHKFQGHLRSVWVEVHAPFVPEKTIREQNLILKDRTVTELWELYTENVQQALIPYLTKEDRRLLALMKLGLRSEVIFAEMEWEES